MARKAELSFLKVLCFQSVALWCRIRLGETKQWKSSHSSDFQLLQLDFRTAETQRKSIHKEFLLFWIVLGACMVTRWDGESIRIEKRISGSWGKIAETVRTALKLHEGLQHWWLFLFAEKNQKVLGQISLPICCLKTGYMTGGVQKFGFMFFL